MAIIKKIKDQLTKFFLGKNVPKGLFELSQYCRHFGAIKFNFEKKDDLLIARSVGYRYGVIITSGRNMDELDKNIKDAILTSFEIPSSYSRVVDLKREDEISKEFALEYALA